MRYRDPISLTNQRRRGPWLWLLVALLLLAVPGYLYGPRLYYRYSDDPLARMERRTHAFLKLRADGSAPDVLLKHVDDSLAILRILEKDQAAEPIIQHYFGLFQFFELIVRIDANVGSLIQLAGRGYLPAAVDPDGPKRPSLAVLGRRIGIRLRRALALQPDLAQADTARLALLYADLFYSARTDRMLSAELVKINRERLAPELRAHYDWMAVLLDVVSGEPARLKKRLAEKKGGLLVEQADGSLLECYAAFRAARYLEALRLARALQSNEDVFRQVEALRMEGEVFLKQRGNRAGLAYFELALKKAGGGDSFLKARIRRASEK